MPILGTIASSTRQGLVTGSFESIATVLVSSNTPTINFTNIPSTYKSLQLRTSFLCTSAENPLMRFGGASIDSGTNYVWHQIYGIGGSPQSNTGTNQTFIHYGYQNSTANYCVSIIDILDYSNTALRKTVRILAGHDNNNTATGAMMYWAGRWDATTTIEKIQLSVGSNFAPGTHAALYGIKG